MNQYEDEKSKPQKRPMTKKMKAAFALILLIMFVGTSFAIVMYTDFIDNANSQVTVEFPDEFFENLTPKQVEELKGLKASTGETIEDTEP